ncbi:MAG: hypothetical protein ACREP1_11480, partial [Rhodanobacteraceae bacterium]
MRIARPLQWAACLGAVLVAFAAGASGSASTPAGTTVQNTASLSYQDGSGQLYAAASNTVTTTFAPVGALVVTPKQAQADPATDSFAVGANITRTFGIANVSNISDAYTIQSVSAAPGKVVSIAFVTAGGSVPVTIGSTVSPVVPAGASVAVQVVVATTGVALGASFPITVAVQTTVT